MKSLPKNSIRNKITALMIAAILISVLTFGITGIYFVVKETSRLSARNLSLVCENRKDVLDEYLESVQQSVNMIGRYSVDSLDSVALAEGGVLGASGNTDKMIPGRSESQKEELDRYFDEHLAFIEGAFESVANHTNGIASYYYRVNHEITSSPKGFMYSKKGVSDFKEMELTDITAYERDDMDNAGWYYTPLRQGGPSWVEPYYSKTMEDWVISYVVPVYKAGTFIGVLGMDIKFDTLVTQIQEFTDFETGHFALMDENGVICYDPEYERGTNIAEVIPELKGVAKEMGDDSSPDKIVRFDKDGTSWQMTYNTLKNNMKLAALVKSSEVNRSSYTLAGIFVTIGVLILIVFTFLAAGMTRLVTEPLNKLTAAAKKLAAGDYDAELKYEGEDEIGALTSAFRLMRDRLRTDFNDLSSRAYTDALTRVRNKAAYDDYTEGLELSVSKSDGSSVPEFAIILMDCDGLKNINDLYGHDKGDIYLCTACRLICRVFAHSPVFRVGGDEFVVVLQGEDYRNREELLTEFEQKRCAVNDEAANPWDTVEISRGMAVYSPDTDDSVKSVFRRADTLMYEHKRGSR